MKWIKVMKKPIEVDAFELTQDMLPEIDQDEFKPKNMGSGGIAHTQSYCVHCIIHENIFFIIRKDSVKIFIETLEGNMEAKVGDYIIKGVRGELYPCRKDIFLETYKIMENKK